MTNTNHLLHYSECPIKEKHSPHLIQTYSPDRPAVQCLGFGEPEAVDHPPHYNQYKGLEIIDLVEQMNFNRGNAVKYIARAGFKDQSTEIEDLKKAAWYLNREIKRLGG